MRLSEAGLIEVGPDDPRPGELSAAILAGGGASRLGGADKTALVVGGRSILDRQLAVLRAVTDSIFIVVADDDGRFAARGVPVVRDRARGVGPLGGLYTALDHADTPWTLVIAGDMPFVSIPLLRRLVARVRDVQLAVPRSADGYHPLCAAYARSALPIVRERIARGALEVQGLVGSLRVYEVGADELVGLDPDGIVLSNVNTPQDYRQACAWAERE